MGAYLEESKGHGSIHTLRMGHLYLSVFLTNLETSGYNCDHTETMGRTPLTTVQMFIVVQLDTIVLLYYVSQSRNSVSCANNFSLIIRKNTFLRMRLLGKTPVPDIYTLYSLQLGDTFLVCPSAGNCIFFTQKLQKKKKQTHLSLFLQRKVLVCTYEEMHIFCPSVMDSRKLWERPMVEKRLTIHK